MLHVAMSHSSGTSDNVDGESSQAESSRQAAHGQRLCTHLQTCHAFEAPRLSWRSRQADELERAMSHLDRSWKKGKNDQTTEQDKNKKEKQR